MGFFDKFIPKEEINNTATAEEPKIKYVEIQYQKRLEKEIFQKLYNLKIEFEKKEIDSSFCKIICREEDKTTVETVLKNTRMPSLTGQMNNAEGERNGVINNIPVREQKTPLPKIERPAGQNFNQNYRPLNQNLTDEKPKIEIEIPEKISVEKEIPKEIPKEKPEEISDEDKKIDEEIAKENKKSSKKKLNRTVQKMTRFTPDEWKKIEEKISSAGISQGDYMRGMMMKGKIVVKERTKNANEILENLKEIKSETGKIGGMMKQIMSKEESLSADEKEKFFAALKTIQDIKTELEAIERRM